ncbi:MAG: hypothetical protein WD851_10375 [Pirellulales bacterium]
MITGTVNNDGVPVIALNIGGRTWTAIIDTGFNGDLELPESLRDHFKPRFIGRAIPILAADQEIEEDAYLVDIWFDGTLRECQATFSSCQELLLGTGLLLQHRLKIDFPLRTVEVSGSI